MAPGTIGLIGGIAGSVIGLAGGIVGTYFSIKNTKTPAERRFVVQVAVATWAALILLLGLPLALSLAHVIPQWAYWITFGLFFVLLGPGINWMNKRQRELRGR